MKTTLQQIKEHMIDYMSDYIGKNDEYYDDDGHCGDALWERIKSYWMDFSTNKDFEYIVSCRWQSDDFDMDGGRDYIFSSSGVIPLLFDYMKNTLNWSKENYEDVIFTGLNPYLCEMTNLSDELEYMFDDVDEIQVIEETNVVKETKYIFDSLNFKDEDYIPHIIKYHKNMKDILDKNVNLDFIGKSLIDEEKIIYKINKLGCRIPKGYDIVFSTKEYDL